MARAKKALRESKTKRRSVSEVAEGAAVCTSLPDNSPRLIRPQSDAADEHRDADEEEDDEETVADATDTQQSGEHRERGRAGGEGRGALDEPMSWGTGSECSCSWMIKTSSKHNQHPMSNVHNSTK
jgi:hypothetical protein